MLRQHFMSFPAHTKEQALQKIYHGVANDITRASALGHRSFVYQPHIAQKAQEPVITTNDIVQSLKNKFPHFMIYPVQKGIFIDWS